jgi:hypothetical protein
MCRPGLRTSKPTTGSLAKIALSLALLVFLQLQVADALVEIAWRSAVLSWDDPDTQLALDIVTTQVPVEDPWRETWRRLLDAALHRGGTLPPAPPGSLGAAGPCPLASRSPPSA